VSEQPLARSEVELSLDFDDLDEELRRDLARRVKRAANTAEKELDRIPKASRKAGKQIAEALGDGAQAAARQVRRAARQVEADLTAAADAGGELGDNVDASAGRAAAALGRVERAARQVQQSLFDIGDDGGFVEIRRQVEAVQTALFDLDTVEIERVEVASERAARSLGGRLASAAGQARAALARVFLNPRAADGSGAGLEDLGEQVTRLGRDADRSGVSLDRYTTRLGLLASAIAVAVAAAPPLIAAGAGIGAAAALAVPAITAVIKGTTEMADRWDGLTRSQRVAASSTRQLIDQYKLISSAVEPETLRLYNSAVAETIRLLPRLQPLAEATAEALTASVQTIGQDLDSPRARKFFDFLAASAGPAVGALTELLGDLAAAAVSTVESIAPLAGTVLGLVSAVARLLTFLNDVNPAFAQLAVLAVALRTPMAAVGGLLGKGADKAARFASGAGKASSAARLLNLVAGAGPNIYVAAGVALAYFAVRALTAKSAIDSTINSINGFNRALGNNIAGYEAANKALARELIPTQQRLAAATAAVGRQTTATNIELAKGALAADSFVRTPLVQAMNANVAAIGRVKDAAAQLVAAGLAPSVASAIRLADVAGVDLSKALDENGQLSASAASKIATYSASVSMAGDTTAVLADAWRRAKDEAVGLTAQTQALQEVMDRFLNPSLAMLDATNRLKEAQNAVTRAYKDGKVSALERSTLLSREVTALRDKLVAEQRATGATQQTTAETLRLLPALSRLAGNSKAGQNAVYSLARSLDGAREDASGAVTIVDRLGHRIKVLPSGKVIKLKGDSKNAENKIKSTKDKLDGLKDKEITIGANTAPAQNAISALVDQITNRRASIPIGIRAPGATGGLVTHAGILPKFAVGGRVTGPGGPRSDKVPALLSAGEYVINARQTRRHLALLRAINAGRFADGGLVGAQRFADGGRISRANNVRAGVVLGLDLSKGLERQLRTRLLAIGDKLGKDLTRALLGSPSEIARAVRGLEKSIARAFSGMRTRIDDRLIARLERVNTRLTGLAKERDKVLKAIEDAQQLAASTTSEARSFAGLAGFDEGERASGTSIEATLRDRLAKIKAFQRDITTLAGRGLDKSLLRQIVEGGPDRRGS
jgi:hypothetical protein